MDRQKVWKVGDVAGVRLADLSELFERRRVPTGTPILLDEAMRPVEPLSSWFRVIGQRGLDVKTMRAYAYTVLMLLNFLTARGLPRRPRAATAGTPARRSRSPAVNSRNSVATYYSSRRR